tara:strand:+ start:43624 stop:43977 length:354 start_codon:yes stop_codon:yes gene_type:complete
MKTTTAFRTDLPTHQGLRTVAFTIDGEPIDFGAAIGDDEPDYIVEISTETDGARAGALVVLKSKAAERMGYRRRPMFLRVVVRPGGRRGMFDGHYLATSDSRWPFETPVPIHDRFEN